MCCAPEYVKGYVSMVVRNRILAFSFLLFIVSLDQVTKFFAISLLELGQPVQVIPNVFNLTLVHNPGAAFGLFADLPDIWRRISLGAVTLLAICVVMRILMVEARGDSASKFAVLAILGGAIGNFIDRVNFDYVIDFLDFYWGVYHWPAFNVADSCICFGVTVLMIRLLCYK